MATIDAFLTEVIDKRGSDLHFIAGDPPRIRLHGELSPLRAEATPAETVREALYEIMPRKAIERSTPDLVRRSQSWSPCRYAS